MYNMCSGSFSSIHVYKHATYVYMNIPLCIVDLYEPEGGSGRVPCEPHPRGAGLHLPSEHLSGIPIQPKLHHRRHLCSQCTGNI